MRGYGLYLAKRLLQFALVVFIGINVTYLITHATPIDPVEQTITAATAFGTTSPEAIAMMRASLQDLYGTGGGALQQWLAFWGRIVVGDFGPSLSAFPTPVSVLIRRALPWTAGLMLVATILSWGLGNLLGGLAGYYRRNRLLKFAGIVAMGVHPVPYYIVAFVLLIVFGYVWPVLPITGAYAQGLQPGFTLEFAGSVIRHSLLPAASLVLVGIGGWFMGMRSLVSNVVTELAPRNCSPFSSVVTCGRPRMLTAAPSPASRRICTPAMRCNESEMVTSGSLPMSCALIASTTLSAFRLISIARACDARMPVTTISPAASSACVGAAT